MGVYIYALNTNVREVSGKKVAFSEFRYKTGSEDERKLYNRTCGRRVDFFEGHSLPDYFVHGVFAENKAVYKAEKKYVVYYDSSFNPPVAGYLRKVGRSWTLALHEIKE